jgi:hypothetical protein
MSTTNQSDVKPRTGFAENEPVVVAHIVLWVLANIGAFIVGHTHLFTSDQWSSFSTGLVPIITAAILSFSAMVARKYVTPFWKRVTDFENRHHLPVLTAAQIDAIVEQLVQAFVDRQKSSVPSESQSNIVTAIGSGGGGTSVNPATS